MPAISIYVPDEMKARMDKAEKSANWSAIAQRAFDVELNHLESIKEVKSMTDVIERLHLSKEKFKAVVKGDGRKLGVAWAKTRGEYVELIRISSLSAESLPDDGDGTSVYTAAEVAFMNVFLDEGRPDEEEMAFFYGLDTDGVLDIASKDFVVSFIEGACDVWDEVKDAL